MNTSKYVRGVQISVRLGSEVKVFENLVNTITCEGSPLGFGVALCQYFFNSCTDVLCITFKVTSIIIIIMC